MECKLIFLEDYILGEKLGFYKNDIVVGKKDEYSYEIKLQNGNFIYFHHNSLGAKYYLMEFTNYRDNRIDDILMD